MNKYFMVYFINEELDYKAPRVSTGRNKYDTYYVTIQAAREDARGDKDIENLVVVT